MLVEDSSIHDGTAAGIFNGGRITVVDTTIFQNSSSQGLGAGIFNNAGSLFLKNVSIIGNTSSISAAGVSSNAGTTRIQNSIVALNANVSSGTPEASDCDSITSLGYNIFGSLNGCGVVVQSSDKLGDPGVGSFSEDTLVPGSGHLSLQFGSPAIDSANDGACTPADQLGEKRAGICDIGAVEFQGRNESQHRVLRDDRHDGNLHDQTAISGERKTSPGPTSGRNNF